MVNVEHPRCPRVLSFGIRITKVTHRTRIFVEERSSDPRISFQGQLRPLYSPSFRKTRFYFVSDNCSGIAQFNAFNYILIQRSKPQNLRCRIRQMIAVHWRKFFEEGTSVLCGERNGDSAIGDREIGYLRKDLNALRGLAIIDPL